VVVVDIDLSVNIAGIKLKNPVMPAAGTFSRDYERYLDITRLGAIVTKTVTLERRVGNPAPRIWETPSGMLNAIGLQNEGVAYFIKNELPQWRKYNVPLIVNIAGSTVEEYTRLCQKLSGLPGIAAIEINISCPNVKAGGMAFGQYPELAGEVVSACQAVAKIPLIVKLSPNVSSIVSIAKAVVRAGADAISLINTVVGMAIDVNSFRPYLASVTGGLSGPAIKPIAVRMVWEVAQAVKVPIIGMGGIASVEDAVEFFLAGASAVAVGTANFINPKVMIEIIDGLEQFMLEKNLTKIEKLIGKIKYD
jgi:dihydroorotate dehydrogenase (NAD+) catalytic subunit